MTTEIIPHNPIIWDAWKNKTEFRMEYHGVICIWEIWGLDFGYDIADLLCIGGIHLDSRQCISTLKLLEILSGNELEQVTFRYVNRWHDDKGVPHHHGVLSKYATLEEAQANIKFNMLDVDTNLVYGPCTEDEMYEFMGDFIDETNDDSDIGDIGTLGWKNE